MPWALRIGAVIAMPLAALAAAGCGGGPQQVSAADLVSKGDEICRQGQERFNEIQAKPPANASDAVEQTKDLVEESEDELNELRDLEPPEEMRDAYDRYLEARGRALEYFRRGEDAAEQQDAQAYAAAQVGVAKRAAERQTLAQAVGFTVCSKAPAAG